MYVFTERTIYNYRQENAIAISVYGYDYQDIGKYGEDIDNAINAIPENIDALIVVTHGDEKTCFYPDTTEDWDSIDEFVQQQIGK